jgi:hypothetical protein
LLAAFTLSARVDNHPDDVESHIKNVTGTYNVSDKRRAGIESKNYSITITKSVAGIAAIELANFGNVMYVQQLSEGITFILSLKFLKAKKCPLLFQALAQ